MGRKEVALKIPPTRFQLQPELEKPCEAYVAEALPRGTAHGMACLTVLKDQINLILLSHTQQPIITTVLQAPAADNAPTRRHVTK
jgi:hypothetical protein